MYAKQLTIHNGWFNQLQFEKFDPHRRGKNTVVS